MLKAPTGIDFKYQWVKNNHLINGATDSNYTATTIGNYKVVVYISRQCGNVSKPVTVISSCKESFNSTTVYPNPSHGIVTITYKSNTTENVQLQVYDKTGRALFTKTEQAIKGNNIYQLNLSHLINGMYNLQLNKGSENSQVKFIIEK